MGKKAEANELILHQAYTLGRFRDDIFRDLLLRQAREACGEGRAKTKDPNSGVRSQETE